MATKNLFGGNIYLKNVRLSFPQLHMPDRPKGFENAEPAYSASFIIDPNNEGQKPALLTAKQKYNDLMKQKGWLDKANKPPKFENDVFKPGSHFRKRDTGEIYDGYEGNFIVVARNTKLPLLLGPAAENLDPKAVEKMFYGGCYVTASVEFWLQDNNYGQALRCTLKGVRFKRDGDAFGGGLGVTAEDFLDEDDDDLGMGDPDLDLGDDSDLGLDDDSESDDPLDDI